jgi:uncharacterized membrane protein
MTRIEKSILIKAPPEKIWEMMAWDRVPEWMDGMKSAEYTSEVSTLEDKLEVGATAHTVLQYAGIKVENELENTECIVNEKSSYRSVSGDMTTFGSMILEPIEEGTKVKFITDYELPYSILGKIVDKLFVQREGEKGVEESLEKLKNILEK